MERKTRLGVELHYPDRKREECNDHDANVLIDKLNCCHFYKVIIELKMDDSSEQKTFEIAEARKPEATTAVYLCNFKGTFSALTSLCYSE